MKPTRAMSARQEDDLVSVLGGSRMPNSGAQFTGQMDGKQEYRSGHYVFSWDAKSTLGKSIGVSLAMWDKAKEQAHWAQPAIPLRFYGDERLTKVRADLIVVSLDTFASVLADANAYHEIAR